MHRMLVLSMFLALPAAAGPAADTAPAPLVVPQPAQDLGELRQNQSVRIRVRVENASDRQLRVAAAYHSCDCLKLDLPVTLDPGEKRDLTATVETHLREGYVMARTNLRPVGVPDARAVDIRVGFTVVPEFKLSAAALDLGVSPKGAPASKELLVERVAAKDVRITGVSIEPPDFDIEGPSDQANGWRLRVQPRAGLCHGEYRSVVSIRTSSPHRPEIRLPVTCTVDDGFVLTPGQATLGIKDYEQARDAHTALKVRRRDGQPFVLSRLRASATYVSAECPTLGQPASEHAVDVGISLITGRPPANTLLSETVVAEDASGKALLRIPVQAILRSSEPCCAPASPEALAREKAALERGVPPYFRTEDLDGHTIDNGAFAGKPCLLLFFCGCPPCHAIAKGLSEEVSEPFGIFGFLHWTRDECRGFVERTHFPGTLLLDTGAKIGERFGAPACPYVIVLDANGRIVHRRLVYLEPTAKVLQLAREALAHPGGAAEAGK